MAANQVNHFPRGKSVTQVPDGVIGTDKVFSDVDWGSTEVVKPRLSQMDVKCRLVQNVSGGAVLPGQLIKWTTALYGTTIGGICTTDDVPNGVVDEYLPAAGCPNNSYCWVVIQGPGKLINDGAGTFVLNNSVQTSTTGRVKIQVAAPGSTTIAMTTLNATAGQAMGAVAATADLKFRAMIKPLMSN